MNKQNKGKNRWYDTTQNNQNAETEVQAEVGRRIDGTIEDILPVTSSSQ